MNSGERYTCPICDLKFKDEIWLEIHVDTHFNPHTDAVINVNASGSSKNDLVMYGKSGAEAATSQHANRTSCWSDHQHGSSDDGDLGAAAAAPVRLSRANSASSLTANVDENFEIDQMAILAECAAPGFSHFAPSTMSVDLEDDTAAAAATAVAIDQFHNGKFVEILLTPKHKF